MTTAEARGRYDIWTKQLVPRIQAELIQGADHFLLTDQAEQVNQRTLEFLNAGSEVKLHHFGGGGQSKSACISGLG